VIVVENPDVDLSAAEKKQPLSLRGSHERFMKAKLNKVS
jgi:hypothetical protein